MKKIIKDENYLQKLIKGPALIKYGSDRNVSCFAF